MLQKAVHVSLKNCLHSSSCKPQHSTPSLNLALTCKTLLGAHETVKKLPSIGAGVAVIVPPLLAPPSSAWRWLLAASVYDHK
jgi:hypothetical protein